MSSSLSSGAIETRRNHPHSTLHGMHDDARVELKFEESRLKEEAQALHISVDDRNDPLRMPKSELSAILMQSREPMTAEDIGREYFNINEYEFPAKKHGFASLAAFLEAFPDKYRVVRLSDGRNGYRAQLNHRSTNIRLAVLSEETKQRRTTTSATTFVPPRSRLLDDDDGGRDVAPSANSTTTFVPPRSRLLDDDDGGRDAAPLTNPTSSLRSSQRIEPPSTTRNSRSTALDHRSNRQPPKMAPTQCRPKSALSSGFVPPRSRLLSDSDDSNTKEEEEASSFLRQTRISAQSTTVVVTAAPILKRTITVESQRTVSIRVTVPPPESGVKGRISTLVVMPCPLKKTSDQMSSFSTTITHKPSSSSSSSNITTPNSTPSPPTELKLTRSVKALHLTPLSPALGALTTFVKKTQTDYEREQPRPCNGRLGTAKVSGLGSPFVSAK